MFTMKRKVWKPSKAVKTRSKKKHEWWHCAAINNMLLDIYLFIFFMIQLAFRRIFAFLSVHKYCVCVPFTFFFRIHRKPKRKWNKKFLKIFFSGFNVFFFADALPFSMHIIKKVFHYEFLLFSFSLWVVLQNIIRFGFLCCSSSTSSHINKRKKYFLFFFVQIFRSTDKCCARIPHTPI